MNKVTQAIDYSFKTMEILNKHKNVHIIKFYQDLDNNLTLLISKVSEAIAPNEDDNHIGEGANMDNFLMKQNKVRFIINGGFNHYRKNFYDWKHTNYQVGDPVGLVKIRHHLFEDYISLENYGFLVQKEKGSPWFIVDSNDFTDINNYKYVLGCTPLLIYQSKKTSLPIESMVPVSYGTINPPSYLGHGLESHPRTAIGIKDNTLYFIIVDGNKSNNGGCSLLELQKIGEQLKLESFLNLDGGGSSQFKLMTEKNIIENDISEEDKKRILGHVLVIFDQSLK